jgi:hypothetical protein
VQTSPLISTKYEVVINIILVLMLLPPRYSNGSSETQAPGAVKCVRLFYLTTNSTAKDTQFTMK